MKIYGDTNSMNCMKVKFTADFLGLDYEWQPIDILEGESRTEQFLALNAAGQVPTVSWEDGRVLAQSNAIIRYLAANSELLPADAFAQAKVDEWLFWEQYSHEPYVAVCRFQMFYLGKAADEREAWRVERGEGALTLMDGHLTAHDWFAGGQFSVADIALYGYTSVAHEGGFDLTNRPQVRAWLDRVGAKLSL